MKIILILICIIFSGCATREKPMTQEQARATWESESNSLYNFKVHTWDYRNDN